MIIFISVSAFAICLIVFSKAALLCGACADGANEASRLWTGVLNPWHVAGGVSQLQSALDKLTNR